jgi:hypothetical protein
MSVIFPPIIATTRPSMHKAPSRLGAFTVIRFVKTSAQAVVATSSFAPLASLETQTRLLLFIYHVDLLKLACGCEPVTVIGLLLLYDFESQAKLAFHVYTALAQ